MTKHADMQTKKSKVTSARRAAYEIVRSVETEKTFASNVSSEIIARYGLSGEDIRFALLLSRGVVSLKGTLDELVNRTLSHARDIRPKVRTALDLSVYELLYLDKEEHAALDQGIELVKWVSPKASGIATHVLHRILEEKPHFPFGDIEHSLKDCAFYHGVPFWLAEKFEQSLGLSEALRFMETLQTRAPLWFAINTLSVKPESVMRILNEQGISIVCEPFLAENHFDLGRDTSLCAIRLVDRRDFGKDVIQSLLAEEKVIPADLSAQTIARLVLPEEKPSAFLEIGSGRGNKTLLLQNFAHNIYGEQLDYDAVEISKVKIEQYRKRIEKAHCRVSHIYNLDASSELKIIEGLYDVVFIDAPCSGLGTLRRHPEITWRLRPEDLEALAKLNLSILDGAARLVRPGGTLFYSTCTLLNQENERVIEEFLCSHAGRDYSIVPLDYEKKPYFNTPLLEQGPDLHFGACLKKKN